MHHRDRLSIRNQSLSILKIPSRYFYLFVFIVKTIKKLYKRLLFLPNKYGLHKIERLVQFEVVLLISHTSNKHLFKISAQ